MKIKQITLLFLFMIMNCVVRTKDAQNTKNPQSYREQLIAEIRMQEDFNSQCGEQFNSSIGTRINNKTLPYDQKILDVLDDLILEALLEGKCASGSTLVQARNYLIAKADKHSQEDTEYAYLLKCGVYNSMLSNNKKAVIAALHITYPATIEEVEKIINDLKIIQEASHEDTMIFLEEMKQTIKEKAQLK